LSASVWVPLVVAGFGILGTLAAALCTQVLQERRDQRLQKEARGALIAERWLRDRQQLYAEFIAAMEMWVRWATTLRYSAVKVPRNLIDPQIPDPASFLETSQSLLARMELIAGDGVVPAARGFWGWAGMASFALAEANRTETNRDDIMRGVRQSYSECVKTMRQDLDIPDVRGQHVKGWHPVQPGESALSPSSR
jgi:hypothetical protein